MEDTAADVKDAAADAAEQAAERRRGRPGQGGRLNPGASRSPLTAAPADPG